jgi:hypothetical protein
MVAYLKHEPCRAQLRNRVCNIVLIIVVVASGLIWRSDFLPLPPFLKKYGGDALWALLVFYGFGLPLNRITTLRLAVISLCFAWTVEFSQLYHAPWIDSIRAMPIGHLVLGSTFNSPDLLAYGFGVGLGYLWELLMSRK